MSRPPADSCGGTPPRKRQAYTSLRFFNAQTMLQWHPSYAPVRKTERFKTLVRKMGLVDYWRAKGWPDHCRPMGVACVDPSPFDIVLVHSQSRFFRDTVGYVGFKRRLQKHAVALISMTQDFGEGPSADFAETIIAASDAFNSAENAKHVTRTMLENARQGFWNGSKPPFGYRTVEVEKRGQRSKKHLKIEEREAAIVRQAFRLFSEGDGAKGPMGVKAIVTWLNHHGFRNANGNPFYTSAVHAILTRETYSGVHYYNCRDGRTRRQRPKSEWVAIRVP